ncbi:TPA: ArsR/SmtB family transcription factor [Listeria monocytogenes]
MLNDIAYNYKSSLYSELSSVGKCLASDKRLEILDLLSQGPKKVESISKETSMSVANTSRHLQVLKESRLVVSSKEGNYVMYKLASDKVSDLVNLLRTVSEEQNSEIKKIQEEFDHSNDSIYTLSLREAHQKLKNKDILLIDLRPRDEYDAGHIKDAQSIPIDRLEETMESIPKDREIIVYCRGRLCAYANLATTFLNKQGFHTYSLNTSYYDWKKFKEEFNDEINESYAKEIS